MIHLDGTPTFEAIEVREYRQLTWVSGAVGTSALLRLNNGNIEIMVSKITAERLENFLVGAEIGDTVRIRVRYLKPSGGIGVVPVSLEKDGMFTLDFKKINMKYRFVPSQLSGLVEELKANLSS